MGGKDWGGDHPPTQWGGVGGRGPPDPPTMGRYRGGEHPPPPPILYFVMNLHSALQSRD